MGIILPNPCGSCGSEPEGYSCDGIRHVFACHGAECAHRPCVIANTAVAALTLWNLSQLPLEQRPSAPAVQIGPDSDRMRKIDDVRRVVRACEAEFGASGDEKQRLEEALLQAVITLVGAPSVRAFIGD